MKRWWLVLCFAAVTAQAGENWPLTYNQGVTAYQSNEFTSAVTSFERATASPDRVLQSKAFYNLGDAYYRMGQAAETQGPEQAIPVFKKSLKGYEDALAFNPKDADAQFNRDLVKKIEELQKKQEQQQDQQKQDQQKKDNQKQDQQKDQQQQQQDKDKQQQEQQKKEQEKARQQKEQQKDKEQQPEQKKQEQQPAQQQAGQTNSVEKVQAQMMLDNLREDEGNWNFFPEVQMKDLKDKGGPVKDW